MSDLEIALPAQAVPVAKVRHTFGFLGIVALVVAMGQMAQQRPVAGGGLVETHAHVIPMYLSITAMNWLLVYFVWKGVRAQGGSFLDLVGGRWRHAREVVRDLALAALFWGVLGGCAWGMDRLLGHGAEKTVEILLPRTALEGLAWILTSASAGFCEEFVFRGYLQRQILAWSQHVWIAVAGQALIFGLMHAYQGWRSVVLVSVVGLLFGILAAWRGSLRPGMLAHGWHDLWAGWLQRLVVR